VLDLQRSLGQPDARPGRQRETWQIRPIVQAHRPSRGRRLLITRRAGPGDARRISVSGSAASIQLRSVRHWSAGCRGYAFEAMLNG
jgi:hypothetical protein